MTGWKQVAQKQVASLLLISWPHLVTSWGREVIDGYVTEIERRGVSPEQAIAVLRSSSEHFPPSVGEVAAAARHDPDTPTFDEAYQMIYGPGGVFGFKRRDVTVSPWVTAFVEHYGIDRLRVLEVDGEYGNLVRKDLRLSWERFLEATETRKVAALINNRGRGKLGRLDPLGALPSASRDANGSEDKDDEAGSTQLDVAPET